MSILKKKLNYILLLILTFLFLACGSGEDKDNTNGKTFGEFNLTIPLGEELEGSWISADSEKNYEVVLTPDN